MIGTYLVHGWIHLFMVQVDYRLFGTGWCMVDALVYVMSPLWDIITGQRFMMTRVARWVLERVQGYLRGIVGSSLH
jgi:hypothetical protein